LNLTAPSLRRRLGSWLYEGVLMFGIVLPAALLFSIATDMRHGLAHRQALIAFLFVVIGLYFVWFWCKGGQTLAMKTWNVRVVDRWLLPPLAAFGAGRVTVGSVFALLLGWVAVWALLSRFHPEKQFWHDAMAGTRLVSSVARVDDNAPHVDASRSAP
jgi:uncharacterized RDD family membrane protein YckC